METLWATAFVTTIYVPIIVMLIWMGVDLRRDRQKLKRRKAENEERRRRLDDDLRRRLG